MNEQHTILNRIEAIVMIIILILGLIPMDVIPVKAREEATEAALDWQTASTDGDGETRTLQMNSADICVAGNVAGDIQEAELPQDALKLETYQGDYDGEDHTAVTLSGLQEGDEYSINLGGKSIKDRVLDGSDGIIQFGTVNEVTEQDVVCSVKRKNYTEWTQNAKCVVKALKISGLTFDPEKSFHYPVNKDEVNLDITGLKADDRVSYSYDYESYPDVNGETVKLSFDNKKPEFSSAGIYKIKATVERANYEPLTLPEVEITVSQKAQTVAFNKTEIFTESNPEKGSVLTLEDGANSAKDFSVSVKEGVAAPKISYEITDKTVAAVDEKGQLTVLRPGITTLNIHVDGDKNYIAEDLSVGIDVVMAEGEDQNDLITFANKNVDYTLGTSVEKYLNSNALSCKYEDDLGEVSYLAQVNDLAKNESVEGLTLPKGSNSRFGVTDEAKLAEFMRKHGNEISITVTATKKPYSLGKKLQHFREAKAVYQVKITFASITDPLLYAAQSKTADDGALSWEQITKPNGKNGWYNTAIRVMPKNEDYQIARDSAKDFQSAVVYGIDQDGKVCDQNATNEAEDRYIFLRGDEDTGISAPIKIAVEKLDTVTPVMKSIDFNTKAKLNIDSIRFFDKESGDIEVTVEAEDTTSLVSGFNWHYEVPKTSKGEDDPYINAENSTKGDRKGFVEAKLVDGKYTATFTLPKDEKEQVRSSLRVTAVDCAGLESKNAFDSDGQVFIVDTISPQGAAEDESYVEYSAATNETENHLYYQEDASLTFKIHEANFFAKDVLISVDGKDVAVNAKTSAFEVGDWDSLYGTSHSLTLKLKSEGDHVVALRYRDRMSHRNGAYQEEEMEVYTSPVITIDRTPPEINFEYANANNKSLAKDGKQSGTLSIDEQNFDLSNLNVTVLKATDLTNQKLSTEKLLTYIKSKENWKDEGSKHSLHIDDWFNDGIYDLQFDYTDLSGRAAEAKRSGEFIVDHTPATDLTLQYLEKGRVRKAVDKALNKLTFGYYKESIEVELTATDIVSGVDHFNWSYQKHKEGNSIEQIYGTVYVNQEEGKEKKDTASSDKISYVSKRKLSDAQISVTIRFEASEKEQLRGDFSFIAVDKYSNVSETKALEDESIIVDNISPEIAIRYNAPSRIVTKKEDAALTNHYFFEQYLDAKITVREANLYLDDLNVELSEDGGRSYQRITDSIEWKVNDEDIALYTGIVHLEAKEDEPHSADKDYRFRISLKPDETSFGDRSNNQVGYSEEYEKTESEKQQITDEAGTTYISDLMTIDTIDPKISYRYSNDDNEYAKKDDPQELKIYIEEHNFDAGLLKGDLVSEAIVNDLDTIQDESKTIANKDLLQEYLTNADNWEVDSKNPDIHFVILNETRCEAFREGIYRLNVDYTDMANRKAEKLQTKQFIVDRSKPDQIAISYSEPNSVKKAWHNILKFISFGYYKEKILVTFTAEDKYAGVHYFTWSYDKEKGASAVNVPTGAIGYTDESLSENGMAIEAQGSKFKASVELPYTLFEELRGNFKVTVTDKYGHSEEYYDAERANVVDHIAPEVSFDRSEPVQIRDEANHQEYYDDTFQISVSVNEANFYPEDVKVHVTEALRNNEDKAEIKEITKLAVEGESVSANGTISGNEMSDTERMVWKHVSGDHYIGTYTVEAKEDHSTDGDYIFTIEYGDRSGNQMNCKPAFDDSDYEQKAGHFISRKMTLDTTAPKFAFNYTNGNRDFLTAADKDNAQEATLVITEHNFDPTYLKANFTIDSEIKDRDGKRVNGKSSLQNYFTNPANWKSEGDKHTIRISNKLAKEFGDGIYQLTIDYKDLAFNAAKQLKPATFIVDHTAPRKDSLKVSYRTPKKEALIEKLTFGYYKPNVTITFEAKDEISGIDRFTWSYVKQEGVSDINVASNVKDYQNQVVSNVKRKDKSDNSTFVGSVTLPKKEADQLRGHIKFNATDKYQNESAVVEDSANIEIVDTISPTMTAVYTEPSRSVENRHFYNKPITATFTVNEANFYAEDVIVELSSDNGNKYERITPTWKDQSVDVHIGTYTIDAPADHKMDAHYRFRVNYQDRSTNAMAEYVSDELTIDTIKPVIQVTYANQDVKQTLGDTEGNSRQYFNATQTATITVTEHNFEGSEVNYDILAKDVSNGNLDANTLSNRSDWSHDGDVHTMTITYPGDANYTFDVDYTDLATNAADDYVPDHFTADKTAPSDLSVSYSTSILETVLSALTFGFYQGKATVTMTANDTTAGVYSFKYSYIVAQGVSGVNAGETDQVIDESGISFSGDRQSATASFEIPRGALGPNNQFNGTITFTATDRSSNESEAFVDGKRIVVDNIAPTCTVTYNQPVETNNNISYYDKAVDATVTIEEANFYEEDVAITVTKDGSSYPVTASWSGNTDVHTGTFSLKDDGDYIVTINYKDKSNNQMTEYKSNQLTVDQKIEKPIITVNGADGNGKAFKDEVVPAISFHDTNFKGYKVTLTRTRFDEKDVDVREQFLQKNIKRTANGGEGTFDTFEQIQDNDGIYTMTVAISDYAGHKAETTSVFTVNRYGSVYVFSDYLNSLIADGGAYVQEVENDLLITEYNADRLVENSLNIEILRDGKPLEESVYDVSPVINDKVEIGESGWYQYEYRISRSNFDKDGIYKIAISSNDATGNRPELANYKDKSILFRVDSTPPEINSITGLETSIINAQSVDVKYTVFDTIGLESVEVYLNDKLIDVIEDFDADANNYAGSFTVKERNSAQTVRLVVQDLAGNVTDTSAETFTSAYAFNRSFTVSTNAFVRFYANKRLFWGTIIGVGIAVGFIIFIRLIDSIFVV